MFFDKFLQLCNGKNISCRKAVSEMGLANSIATKWKKTGATPNAETLKIVADYFDVTVSYLLDAEKENAKPELSEVDKRLFSIIKDLSDAEKLMMLDMIKTIKEHRK